jgi:hypothetical protein
MVAVRGAILKPILIAGENIRGAAAKKQHVSKWRKAQGMLW